MSGFLDNLPGEFGQRQKQIKKRTAPPSVPAVVIWHVIRCPMCKSENIKVVGTKRPVRYHKCDDCGHKFKSVEKK